jgi:LysM repeat protein
MYKHTLLTISSVLMLSSCGSHLASFNRDKFDTTTALDEMRIEISDMRHTLSNAQVEMQILEDRVRAQEEGHATTKSSAHAPSSDTKITALEKKLAQIEKMQAKLNEDLRLLSTQAAASLSTYSERIKEVESDILAQAKLMQEILGAKASVQTKSSPYSLSLSNGTYRVKAGDTLEKIAKNHGTTVAHLQQCNQLSSTKIIIGQEIKVPHANP